MRARARACVRACVRFRLRGQAGVPTWRAHDTLRKRAAARPAAQSRGAAAQPARLGRMTTTGRPSRSGKGDTKFW
jgi:hypothetical protein